MAVVWSDSQTGQTTGITLTAAPGVGDKKLCQLDYYVKMTDPGAAGLIYFIFRWIDRDGTAQAYTSAALAVAGTARIHGVVPFWSEDSSGAGAYTAYEIVTVGVAGSYEFEWWAAIDEMAQGN